MPGIHDVQEKVVEFFSKELAKDRDALHFVKLTKSPDGWEAKVEVTEQNGYLKRLGYPAIFDKNIYTVSLSPELEVMGYTLGASRERSYTTEEREEV